MYVSIVDYGTGNLNSVSKALEAAATNINKKLNIKISNNPKDILDSDKIILPGQGSYRQCVLGLKNISGLWDSINEFVLNKKKPIFGICVGMQLFSDQGCGDKTDQQGQVSWKTQLEGCDGKVLGERRLGNQKRV